MSKVTTAIMAGGKSSRMGVDKSFVPFMGMPMIERVIERLAGLGDELILIANEFEPYSYLDLPLHADIYPECGPLGGLHSALTNAAHPNVLVVACDMPWLNRELLGHMISLRDSADIIVPRWQKFPEPLHALYSKRCLAPIEVNLKRNTLKLTAFYGRLNVRYLDRAEVAQFDPKGRSFANVNSPADLLASQSKPNELD